MSLKVKEGRKFTKPGENLENQLLVPVEFLTRRKVKKPGGLAALEARVLRLPLLIYLISCYFQKLTVVV
jgi:hypothetical protein